MDPGAPYPPRYEMLNNDQGYVRPPPGTRRNIPRYQGYHSGRSSNCCLRCICCFYCSLLIVLLLFVLLALSLYAIYQPQVPSYKVDRFKVNTFDLQGNSTLSAEFVVTVKAENPNNLIGFNYGKDNSIILTYHDRTLCSGKMPEFHQPQNNIAALIVALRGKSQFGSKEQEVFRKDQESGKVPLLVRVRVPLSVVLGRFPLREVVVYLNCYLVVDSLAAQKNIKILSANYTYEIEF